MRTNRFGIVALVAAVMLGANCGGPDNGPTDGGGNTDAGCEPNCQPAFTAFVKAYSPASTFTGRFVFLIARSTNPADKRPTHYFSMPECEDVTECDLVIAKPPENADEVVKKAYELFLVTKRLFIKFEPKNGLYVMKDLVFTADRETKEVRWGEGEGGLDPGGKTYRGTIGGTYQNVRATVDRDTEKVVVSGLPCGPFITITNFSRSSPNCGSVTGYISADLATIHIELRRNDGSLNYEEDAVLIQ